jgi:hypothetical protein
VFGGIAIAIPLFFVLHFRVIVQTIPPAPEAIAIAKAPDFVQ